MSPRSWILLILVSAFSGCRKQDNPTSVSAAASAAHLDSIRSELTGTWAYTFWRIDFVNLNSIPNQYFLALNASLQIDPAGPMIHRFDYNDQLLASYPFSLSGAGGIDSLILTDSTGKLRHSRITKLSSDSLVLETVERGQDTGVHVTATEVWTKALPAEAEKKVFRITITSPAQVLYDPGATVSIFVTPSGGTEELKHVDSGVVKNYEYSFVPNNGDHIRMTLRDPSGQPAQAIVQGSSYPATRAFYKGISYGDGWTYIILSRQVDQQWDIAP